MSVDMFGKDAGKNISEALVTAAVSGISSVALQHLGDQLGFDYYTAAVTNLTLTSAIRGAVAGYPLSLGKDILMAGAQQTAGGFLSGGIATLDAKRNFVYQVTPNASFAAGLIDFSRRARKLNNSSGEIRDDGLQVMDEYMSYLHACSCLLRQMPI